MFQQRVALRNVPLGSCTFVLTPKDLGNFMTHPLLATPAATAVQASGGALGCARPACRGARRARVPR